MEISIHLSCLKIYKIKRNVFVQSCNSNTCEAEMEGLGVPCNLGSMVRSCHKKVKIEFMLPMLFFLTLSPYIVLITASILNIFNSISYM